jgi:hypothetical protein
VGLETQEGVNYTLQGTFEKALRDLASQGNTQVNVTGKLVASNNIEVTGYQIVE